uniref:Galectin n=1 Tax=Astyanax mexicanus TaxID=7994 RepID=A0A3B1IU50_ASTMX
PVELPSPCFSPSIQRVTRLNIQIITIFNFIILCFQVFVNGVKHCMFNFRNGKWESEESASAEPFTRGAPFTMFFTINTEGYEVFVNGVKHCMFKHRIPVEKVSTLNIGGDVSLNMIG